MLVTSNKFNESALERGEMPKSVNSESANSDKFLPPIDKCQNNNSKNFGNLPLATMEGDLM